MRFSVKTTEQGSIDALTIYNPWILEISAVVAKLSKTCIIRIANNKRLFFTQNENIRERAYKLWIELDMENLFDDFVMNGYSEEHDEIYLAAIPDELHKVLRPISSARSLRIKLSKKGNPSTPHLTFEFKQQRNAGSDPFVVTHDVPVFVIAQRYWDDYQQPTWPNNVKIAVTLPSTRVIQRVVAGIKNIGCRFVVLSACHDGRFTISGDTSAVDVSVFFTKVHVDKTAFEDNDADKDEFVKIRVDVRTLHTFLLSQQQAFGSILLSIVPGKLAHFSIDAAEFKMQYFIPGICL